MKKFTIISLFVLVVLIGVGGYLGYAYWVDAKAYFTTDNASVTANTVKITAPVAGEVAAWTVGEGDYVTAGDVLGMQKSDSSPGLITAKADITTPITGTVVQSSGVEGAMVSGGMQLALIADTDHMYINANIEETDINRIEVGQEVIVNIDAYPDQTFTGNVENIGEATKSAFSTMPSLNTSGTYTKVTQLIPVKISIDGIEDYKLRLGYNATVKIKTP